MIEVSGLTRYYGEATALDDVSFKVEQGEIIGLLGLNGAGKSTTLKILAGLLAPSRGRVVIDGIDVAEHPEQLRGRIGYLPEDPPLYTDMTVIDFLAHMGRIKGMSGDAIRKRLPEVIALTQLGGREYQVIGTLSHGYKKRVGIAQAVIHDPRLVILDEPISGLDPSQIVEMRKVVRGLGEGRAVLVSSHILSEVSQTCDRIFVIHRGKLVASGTEHELAHRAGNETCLVLTVRGAAEAFQGWLKAWPKVKRFVAKPAEAPFAAAEIWLDGDLRERLVADAIAAGFGIRLVEQPADELEEIFLGLTRQGATA